MFRSTQQIGPQTQSPLYQDESDLCEPGVGYFWKGLLEVVLYSKKSSLIWFSIYFALRLKGEGFSPFQFYIWAKRKRKPFSDDDTITACSVGIVLGCRLACGTPGTWIVRRDADFRREPFGQVGDYFQAAL